VLSVHASWRAPFPPSRANSVVLGRRRPWKAVDRLGGLRWRVGALQDQADDEVLLLNDTGITTLEKACGGGQTQLSWAPSAAYALHRVPATMACLLGFSLKVGFVRL
jgi:hypothetical protein